MSTEFIQTITKELAPLGFRKSETSIDSGDFAPEVTIIERIKVLLIRTKGKTLSPVQNYNEFTRKFAKMVGYNLIRGLSVGIIIFSDEPIHENILQKIVGIKTERNAIIHWAINIPSKEENISCVHTFTTVPSTSIFEYLIEKLGITEPYTAITFLKPNKHIDNIFKFSSKLLSLRDYFIMFFVLLLYFKFSHEIHDNNHTGLNTFIISYFTFFYLVGIYLLTIKPYIEENSFDKKLILKIIKVWVTPIIF